MSVGSKIKELRESRGLSQKELADTLHVTYQAVLRWESDEAEPSSDSLKTMCKFFGCRMDEIINNKEEVSKANANNNGIGHKIKEYRTMKGMTQKDLADTLHVTYQAVSRWENNDAEPSIDSLKAMCKIFNCTTDELFGMKSSSPEKVQVVEKVVVQESKPVLAVCECCNRPIYNANEVFRTEEKHVTRKVRGRHSYSITKKVLCKACNDKRLAAEKKAKDEAERQRKVHIEKKRTNSFVWPTILSITLLIIGIVGFVNDNPVLGGTCMFLMVFGYFFLAVIILNNTFVTNLWLEVASWGFVKMPGILFTADFEGLKFLIVCKFCLWLLGIALTLFALAFATFLSMLVAPFAYPSALKKNYKYIA